MQILHRVVAATVKIRGLILKMRANLNLDSHRNWYIGVNAHNRKKNKNSNRNFCSILHGCN